jgi:tetratricopeptide (TPR) repeat protein
MRFKYFGEEHSQTIISLDNLAYVYSQIGDLERSFELYEKCYELRCKVFGEDDSETLRTLDNLAISYEDFGEYEAAHELYEKCYTLRAEYLGEMNPDTLSSLSHLALSFGQNGNYEKAIELHKKCYELSRKVPKHGYAFDSLFSPTLEYTRNLANAYRQFCDYTNATKYYEKCYAFCRKNYGESDIQTVEAMEDIAFTYQLANNDAKALELYEKSYNLRCNTLGEDHRSSLLIKEYIDGIRKKLSGQ